MLDNRKGIPSGNSITFDDGFRVIVEEELGRGASCIVYAASYVDLVGAKHVVRIKECYPVNLKIKRQENLVLKCEDSIIDQFNIAKEKFLKAYESNVLVKNKLGLTNSTTDAISIKPKNNTWYSVIANIEGVDYRTNVDENIKSVFTRMITLSKVVEKYHVLMDRLHLDIKPENVLIPPESKERIILFDFDSMVSKEELKNNESMQLSYSDGFSAPELVQGRRSKICEATDVYGIGAIIFFKLFGRVPTIADGDVFCDYDFSKMKYADVRYQPVFLRKLDEFLHKTIATSVSCRYKNMEIVIGKLQELIKLSDLDAVNLCDNFSYNTPCFVGRRLELEQLNVAFVQNQVVFLSGIGGIGKTEIAKRYALENRSRYNRIIFVPFNNSLFETICGDDIRINNFSRESVESNQQYFERKIKAFEENVVADDLIIIDNFDVDADDYLDRLVECGACILFTTRKDYSDEFCQIDISEMEEIDGLVSIFEHFNHNEYSNDEYDSIVKTIEYVDRHTMTVDLIAKYIRASNMLPSDFLQLMMGKEGITNTDDTCVKHRKDRKSRAQSVMGHLLTLFDLYNFTDLESQLIKSLSLFGTVRISKALFLKLYNVEHAGSDLELLIKNGWIEENNEKISLHQVILDLIYNECKPAAENCPHIIRGMISYFAEREASRINRRNKQKLGQYFIERVCGTTLSLAELYVEYSKNLVTDEILLEKAEEICDAYDSEKSKFIKVEALMLRIRQLPQKYDWWEDENKEKLYNEVYENVQKFESKIFEILRSIAVERGAIQNKKDGAKTDLLLPSSQYVKSDKIPECIRKLAMEMNSTREALERSHDFLIDRGYDIGLVADEKLVSYYFRTAEALEKIACDICNECMEVEASVYDGIKGVFLDAENLLKYALNLADNDNIGFELKEEIYKDIIEFYSEDDFCNMAKCECVGNSEKSAYYSEQLSFLRGSKNDGAGAILYLDEMSFLEAADQAAYEKQYWKAIPLYKKALDNGESLDDDILYRLGKAYQETGDYDAAEECLLKVLQYDKKMDLDCYFTYEALIDLYRQAGRRDEAFAYCDRIVEAEQAMTESSDNEAITRILYCLTIKLQLRGTEHIEKSEMEKIETYLLSVKGEEKIDTVLVDTFIVYSGYLISIKKIKAAITILFESAEKYRVHNDDSEAFRLYAQIFNNVDFLSIDPEKYIKALVWGAVTWIEGDGREDWQTALCLCEDAEKYLEDSINDNVYISALINRTKGDIYLRSLEYDYDQVQMILRQCNYYLLTQRVIESHEYKGEVYEEWKNCAENYLTVDNPDMARQCLEQMKAALDKAKQGATEYKLAEKYIDYYRECIKCDKQFLTTEMLSYHADNLFALIKENVDVQDTEAMKEYRGVFDELAEAMLVLHNEKSAMYIYLLEIGLFLKPLFFQSYKNTTSLFEEKNVSHAIEAMNEAFPEVLEEEQVDMVTDILTKMVQCVERSTEVSYLKEKIEAQLGKYQYSKIEFKR